MKEISDGKLITSYDVDGYKNESRFLTYLYENKISEETIKQNSFKFIFNFFAGSSVTMLIFLIVLFSSDIFTKEYEDSTIKLMLVQPVSRKKMLLGKYLSLICSIIFITLTTMFTTFIIIGIKDGFGNPNYPYIYNMKYVLDNSKTTLKYIPNSGIYIPASCMMIKQLLFFLLFSITIASITFMISVLSSTSTISTTIAITLNMFLIYFVFATNFIRPCTKYIYVTYGKISSLFSGKLKVTLNNNAISPLSGILLMIILTICCYLISCIPFNKKDI